MNSEPITDIRLKRLYFRSCHRGSKEMDIVLGHFANAHLRTLEPETLSVYERLLEEDDAEIWDWLIGKSAPEAAEYLPLIETLKGYGLPTE